ncbi:Vps52-domain-containing protein [Myriangium duriaei CBS 260.36]|uniref:Vps52-domain-containing protein n=1 Tax=Myriangium duriaei CBS 260.36 TaxID=1168546 RepID=A0A9P4MGW4_9PEZI|nr:Vps52-domain-containing protein [Myriangium duriaei CBS 260.36]
MWLDRFSGQNTPSASPVPWNRAPSPAPGRSSLHLSRNPSQLRRPELPQRVSSWSGLVNGSSESLVSSTRDHPRSSLRNQLFSESSQASDPFDVLNNILGSSPSGPDERNGDLEIGAEEAADLEIDFGGLSLQDFAHGGTGIGTDAASDTYSVGNVNTNRSGLEDLHKSIQACDEILVSVEKNLTVFQADLAAVSAEIESLQNQSTDLSERLQRRKDVEKRLGPEVDKLIISPAVVRKITEGVLDESWARGLQDLDKAFKVLERAPKFKNHVKAVEDITPLLENLKDRAVERVRDHVVAQIRALRSPSINAQVLQKNALSKFKDAYSFLAKHQPKLEEEIAQAYVNTMRWYYLSNFTRYKASLEKLRLHTIDKNDTLAQDDPTKRTPAAAASRQTSGPFDAFVLGRRIDILRAPNPQALSSFVAEEDKGIHFLETPFRAFNLALIDNASAEFSFMTEFFSKASFHTVSKRFLSAMEPTRALGQSLTKQLVDTSTDALGILMCVRLNQHFAFEMQRRQVSSMENYINGTSMILWPRFQMVMDMQCEALKKAATNLSGRPAGLALNLTSSNATVSSAAPHPITQRFANFAQGILSLSRDAGDDEPVQRSLSRLCDEFHGLLVKLSKSVADAKKRERFIINNASLVSTIVVDCEGKMADIFKERFAQLK